MLVRYARKVQSTTPAVVRTVGHPIFDEKTRKNELKEGG